MLKSSYYSAISLLILISVASIAQPDITKMEYFIDADPGRGLGVDIPIAASSTIDLSINIPTTALSEGFHILTVRGQDQNGEWSLSENKVFFVSQSSTISINNISKIEYFIDVDPGRGLGVDIPITPAASVNVLENISTISLTEGFHTITVRAQDENLEWSLSESRIFYVNQSSSLVDNNITKIEYFIDADPGRGLGVDIPITPATTFDFLENVPTTSLTDGFHMITVRAQDQNGNWSLAESKVFFVSQSSTLIQNNITKIEYFIDTDPGHGAGVDIPVTPATNFDFLENVGTGTLTDGFHLLTVRAQDQNGKWSLAENKVFYVNQSSTLSQNTITKIEYFIDTDPGQGAGVDVPITPATNLNFLENIPTGSLTEGFHLLTIRAQDQNGEWSLTQNKPFFVDRGRQIITYEYAIDTDPGVGLAMQQPVAPQDSIDLSFAIPTGTLSLGSHDLFLRVQDENQFWSKTEMGSFNLCDGGNAAFLADVVCAGSATSFSDLSTNVLPGDTYSWDFDNDGFEDDNTIGSTSFTYASAGSFVASLSIDRSGCISQMLVAVNVIDLPTSIAGSDQTICEGSTVTLNGIIGGSATSSLWTTSGTGTFDNDSSPIAIYTPDTDDITSGSVTLTLTASESMAICTDVSQTIVTIQSLPTANAGSDQIICSDAIVSLSGSIGGSAATSMWTSNGSGTFADATSITTTYTPTASDIAAGSLIFTLTASETLGACSDATSQLNVTINEVPVVDAGPDQSICTTEVVNLTGVTSGNFSSQFWSTSGTGTFDNTSSLNAVYTPSTADHTSGSVVLTLTVTGIAPCVNVTSQLTVSINSVIQVVEQNADASIGVPITIDVFNGSTSSPGDVLTTTILQIPTKGMATLLADGSIDYLASENNIGLDTVVFEVCNQCASCDTNNAVINILNEPPFIGITPVSAEAGSTITLNLEGLLSDLNNNIDLTTLEIIVQPSSGATAIIDAFNNLLVDYRNIDFSGTDQLTLRVCDFLGACSETVIFIEVSGESTGSPPITIYNAISPNGDDKHDFLEIENIEAYADNKIVIYDRWGSKVFEANGYDNDVIRFEGSGNTNGAKDLPGGTYYYKLDLGNGLLFNGFFILKN